jgi:hypothetical protein
MFNMGKKGEEFYNPFYLDSPPRLPSKKERRCMAKV